VLLLCLLLAGPVVEGRVRESSGIGVQGAQVTLLQGPGDRTQIRRTDADGSFRFRAFEGPAAISVMVPKGWTVDGPTEIRLKTLGDRTEQTEFKARARRVLRGKLLVRAGEEIAPLSKASIGTAQTDEQGAFSLEGLAAGRTELAVDLLPAAAVEMPAGPAEVARDIVLVAPSMHGKADPEAVIEVAGQRLRVVPQPPAERSIADWAEGRPMSDPEIGAIERLSALANLDPSFRLLLLTAPRPGELGRAMQAAMTLHRYLTGPGLLPRERLIFAIGKVARRGVLALILTRVEPLGER
jgi:hypothetical protein